MRDGLSLADHTTLGLRIPNGPVPHLGRCHVIDLGIELGGIGLGFEIADSGNQLLGRTHFLQQTTNIIGDIIPKIILTERHIFAGNGHIPRSHPAHAFHGRDDLFGHSFRDAVHQRGVSVPVGCQAPEITDRLGQTTGCFREADATV